MFFLLRNDHQVTIGPREPFRTTHACCSEHNVTKRFSKEALQSSKNKNKRKKKSRKEIKITSLVAHWKPATTLSLISFKYCTPFVQSIKRFGPVPSGPKHQIFLASVTSYSYFSFKYLARILKSCLVLTSFLSMSSGKPSGIGTAFMYNLLCLFGDLDKQTSDDSSVTVSLYETTGSDTLIGMQA